MNVLKLGMLLKDFITQLNANFTEISGKLTDNPVSMKVLFSGTANIPSASSDSYTDITLSEDMTGYDGLMFVREDTDTAVYMTTPTVGTVFKVVNKQADFGYLSGMNLYGCNATVISSTVLRLNNNLYSGIKTTAAGRYMTGFEDTPLKKVIGIKLN